MYILGTGTDGMGRGEGCYALLADDGEFMASHFCSHAGYAQSDLHDGRPERIDKWKERFGEYQVLWLGDDDTKLETLLELNKKWADEYPDQVEKSKENKSSISIEISE